MRKAVACEMLGTFLLVAVGGGAAAWDAEHGGLGLAGVAVAFGAVVGLMVFLLGPHSGAHLNPAVTLSFWLRRHIASGPALAYTAAQGAGAVAGAAAVLFLLPVGFPAARTAPLGSLVDWQTCSIEAIATFLLVFVILVVAVPKDVPQWLRALAIGAAVAFGAYVAGPLTGGSMNPARTFGPALVAGDLALIWLYVVGPVAGAVAALLAYHLVVVRLGRVARASQPGPPPEGPVT